MPQPDDDLRRASSLDIAGGADAVEALLEPGRIEAWFQPVVGLADLQVAGYEALARVDGGAGCSPQVLLTQASCWGLRERAELACLDAVSRAGPPPDDLVLFVNLSPELMSTDAARERRDALPRRLVVELSEQAPVDDYDELRTTLAQWASDHVRFAIDDAGAGYASLSHIIELAPDFVKIDASLVRNLHLDRKRHALLRALVTFAREVGAAVIAEGVEQPEELEALRELEVHFAQGFLLGRPQPGFARAAAVEDRPTSIEAESGARSDRGTLAAALAAAVDAESAAEAVARHLYRRGGLIPSIYLERHGVLRCVARRGLWQVLDGMGARSGITGHAWSTGRPVHVPDVAMDPRYLEAVPGVVAEYCAPLLVDGRSVGALNIEALTMLGPGAIREVDTCAGLLGVRLGELGHVADRSPWLLAAAGVAELAETAASVGTDLVGAGADPDAAESLASVVLRVAVAVSGLRSALLVRGSGRDVRRWAIGPLEPALNALTTHDLDTLAGLVQSVRSCYTAGDVTGRGFVGTERLRTFGVRTAAVLPLTVAGGPAGIVLLVDTEAVPLGAPVMEPLEVVIAQATAALATSSLVARLRSEALTDGLTGLGNRSALHQELGRYGHRAQVAVLVGDVDGFKYVNDRLGHVVGDELLHALGAAMIEAVDADAQCFRYGGDEIVVLSPARPAAELLAMQGRLHDAAFEVLSPYGAGITFGAAQTERGETPADTLRRADSYLLAAKHTGRSRLPARHELVHHLTVGPAQLGSAIVR